jgi:hypothetical protein
MAVQVLHERSLMSLKPYLIRSPALFFPSQHICVGRSRTERKSSQFLARHAPFEQKTNKGKYACVKGDVVVTR